MANVNTLPRRTRKMRHRWVLFSIILGMGINSCRPSGFEEPAFAPHSGLDVTGWSDSTCWPSLQNDSNDVDRDNVVDDCEYAIANVFRPVLAFHPEEQLEDTSRETYWAVRRGAGRSLLVLYALAYHWDRGDRYNLGKTWKLKLLNGHEGDSEVIVVAVRPGEGDRWRADSVALSAHSSGASQFLPADSLSWHNAREGGRPIVWVSIGKHANYQSTLVCNESERDGSCVNDPRVRQDVEVLRGANLGSRAVPLVNCVGSRSPEANPGMECFWEHRLNFGFRGWQRDSSAPYDSSVVRPTTPYGVILQQYEFGQLPPRGRR